MPPVHLLKMAAEKLKKSKKQSTEAAEGGQVEVAAKKAKKSDKEKKEKKRAAGSDDEGEVKKKKAKKAAEGGTAAKAVDKAAGQADDSHAGEGAADGKPKADPELSLDKFDISPSVKSLLVRRKDRGHARAVQRLAVCMGATSLQCDKYLWLLSHCNQFIQARVFPLSQPLTWYHIPASHPSHHSAPRALSLCSPSRPRRCPTAWLALTLWAALAPAAARPLPSACPLWSVC